MGENQTIKPRANSRRTEWRKFCEAMEARALDLKKAEKKA